MKDKVWNWISGAPTGVVLSICVTMFMALGGWVWTVAADQGKQITATAVAVEKSAKANEGVARVESRLDKIDTKLDSLLQAVAAVKAAQDTKSRKEK